METLIGNANRGSISTGAYEIENSCRFEDDDTVYMHRTPSSSGTRTKWTYSGWCKRSEFGFNTNLQGTGDDYNSIRFEGDDQLRVTNFNDGSYSYSLVTTRVFRDCSAWYHVVAAMDTTQGTASDRLKMYVNGVQETDFSVESYPNQNYEDNYSESSRVHQIGARYAVTGNPVQRFAGCIADVHFVDGAQKAATDFGEFNDDGIWVPKEYSGSHGTNGFHLKFDSSGSMGADSSGNSNTFTLVNLDAGNQMTDTPTNNFNVLNINDKELDFDGAVTDGGLQITSTAGAYNLIHSTMAAGAGKWYCECKIVAVGSHTTHFVVGHSDAAWTYKDSTHVWGAGDGAEDMHDLAWSFFSAGDVYNGSWTNAVLGGGWDTSQTRTTVNGDIYMLATDYDNGKFWIGKNGVWFNTNQGTANPATGAYPMMDNLLTNTTDDGQTTSMIRVGFGYYGTNSRTYQVNFGNPIFSISSGNADGDGYGNFEYAPPSGYYAWCTKNLAEYG